ncbi:MAG: SH3 domain-containing protein [Alphaproteobacteria bacterium]|nr:MAG: SH3 domain-containing protein [Alphaproteobacteria bacterium]
MRVSIALKSSLLLTFLFLSACAEMSGYSRTARHYQTTLPGAESGSRYATTMMGADVKQISETAWRAVEARSGSTSLSWSSVYSGATGKVSAGPNYLVGFNAGEEIEAPVDLDTTPYMAPEAGKFVTMSNTNVRLSPGLSGAKVMMLALGDEVQAIAREPSSNWVMVAKGDQVIGYVFGDLISRVEGGELLLAGGEPKQPRLCRELTYTMTLGTGEKDAWVNGACKQNGSDWRVVGGRALEVAVY